MVDFNKRSALKILGGSAVAVSVPSLALAIDRQFSAHGSYEYIDTISEAEYPLNTNAELSIALSVDPTPVVRLTNKSKQLIVVRHIHPGIVNAGDRAFNLNSIFSDGAYAIEAGSSRDFKISPTSNIQAETSFPRHLYRNKPQRVVSVRGADRHGEIVNSSRSFFA